MKNFDLSYNLFEKEIEIISHLFMRATSGYGEYEGDDGWLHDSESIDIIHNQLDQMKENRNESKKIILDVLNDKNDKYPYNVKLFYIGMNTVLNDKNKLIYDGNNVEDSKNILKDMVVDCFKNGNFISSIINYDKVEEFAEKLVNDTSISIFEKCDGNLGNVIGEYINNNTKLCIEMFGDEKENNIQDEETKIHNQKDFEKLSEFANKLGKDELNELQNILIQCEYDDKVLSDFTSAVDKVVVNKNVEENYLPVDTMMIYNTKTSDFYDISMADKNGNKWLSFEKFVDLLNDYKNDNLIVVQAKLPTFKEFEPWENATIKGMFAVAKDNGNKLMDFVTVNVDSIKKNGEGQYNFKSIIDKDCYSYKFKTKQNVKIHFNKLEVNEELKSKQGFYANETQAQKIETATATLK